MKLGLLFPGQGAQHVGMGRDLAEAFPEAARIFEQADEALGFRLSDIMWNGPEHDLTRTKNAQSAILVHSVATLMVLRDRIHDRAVVAAGHSLGEFSAYVATETLSFEDALHAVRLRGKLMYASGEERQGTMAAVLGLDDDLVTEVCASCSSETSTVVPANFNAPGQVVVSGDIDAVERVIHTLKEAGAKRVLPLNVSGAFHSPLMGTAEAGLREQLDRTEFSDPMVPVVSNVTARPNATGPQARELLVRQLTSPVRWASSVGTMVDMGVEGFVEFGPGAVLAGLNKRNARGIPTESLGTPEAIEATELL